MFEDKSDIVFSFNGSAAVLSAQKMGRHMFNAFKSAVASSLILASLLCAPAVRADERAWRVEKSTGDVWMSHGTAQQVSLGAETDLTAGDNIRTGRNGRVLLVRGQERILVSPNSAIGIPTNTGQFPTTISQQAGSILLEVEKKNVQHFEVETPYLAAVVKGTQFRVSVDRRGAKVDVLRGRVQVSDFKSGQTALVMPGQAAKVGAHGQGGLFLSGKGQLNPIERGAPRTPSVQALVLPKADRANRAFAKETAIQKTANGDVRIGSALGELKLDIHKATNGLAHSSSDRFSASAKDRAHGLKGSIDAANGVANSSSAGAEGSNAAANGSAGSGAFASGNGNSTAGGNGNSGGNGNGNGGNGGGNGNGNNGNGNGNGGGNGSANNGHGNGNGKAKGSKGG